jgi:hypothetical protein
MEGFQQDTQGYCLASYGANELGFFLGGSFGAAAPGVEARRRRRRRPERFFFAEAAPVSVSTPAAAAETSVDPDSTPVFIGVFLVQIARRVGGCIGVRPDPSPVSAII